MPVEATVNSKERCAAAQKVGAGELLNVVLESDEGLIARLNQDDVEQAHPERAQEWDPRDKEDYEGGRGDHRPGQPLLTLWPAPCEPHWTLSVGCALDFGS